ncbi:hypothetical protein BAUCODRAFT_514262 [Baudoinia panamericana UAMH 10762]|uniref:DWNN domain-containing protein n=1 Tax=Baudoinia panamericana (strain UAMH 10762) TaxID=717646 RepID=M2NB19_BAUPA|nr:uncharacterized protein BAUCODRAFT_514262 [Baudoinia panamericana UAMH 10762]EMC96035.1 hypothetical protein BAUCODRAFT_514262 [Baudoinia panamericana UAMH 10762]
MSSSIFFRFKSQKEPLQITFDGTSLSVFEVKREIIAISKLGDGTDFDLEIYTPEAMEKYDDDTTQIPRSTTVIARRLPATKPGAGRAARYVTGKMPIMAKNQHRVEQMPATSGKGGPASSAAANGNNEMTEEEKLAAMLNANNEVWKQDQALNAGKPIIRNTNYKSTVPAPDKPLPPGYTCHRCGEKGHWIQACPTNNDPTFDGRPKFRRTTGIPRSMLKVIEKPTEVGEDGKIDVSKLPAGVMYTSTGEWVIAEPDKVAWEKFQEKQNASAAKAKEAVAEDAELVERGLSCPIDKRAFVDPVKTPCCGRVFCRDCIENALLDGDLNCPNCGEQVLLDKLEADEAVAKKVAAFEDERKAARVLKDKEASRSPSAVGSPAKAGTPPVKSEVPSANVPETKLNGTVSTSSTSSSRKRGAEAELPNNRKGTNPAMAKKQQPVNSKTGTPIPTGPKASTLQQPPTQIPNNMQGFVMQMQSMASSMPGMPNGMNAMMNPMMMNNPMLNPMMINPMMGMGGFPMGGMNGMPNGGGWVGPQQQGWGMGIQNGGGSDGAYMRQPVNPHRHQGRQRRQRSVDYKQMGS